MSQENENVEIARNVIEALNRGDVDAALRNAAPDFVLDQTRAFGLDRGSFDLDQVRRLWRDLEDHWESVQLGFDEFIATGEHIVTPFANRLTGRDGVSVEARGTWVWIDFATASSGASASTRSGPRPSKPRGCRSSALPLAPWLLVEVIGQGAAACAAQALR